MQPLLAGQGSTGAKAAGLQGPGTAEGPGTLKEMPSRAADAVLGTSDAPVSQNPQET